MTDYTRTKWLRIRALKPSEPRYLHVSAKVAMHPNPLGRHMPMLPWIQRPGTTFNVGRNKAKHEKRAAAKALRARTHCE